MVCMLCVSGEGGVYVVCMWFVDCVVCGWCVCRCCVGCYLCVK